ncbi:MAG: ABC transporter ATP-binding protein [Alphaproteobacteria bacterium]
MINLDSVTKVYSGRRVVDLSLDINRGEFCVLVGPSGCGKSTTLRMINRLIKADSGRIFIEGEDISSKSPELLRRGIGYAIQSIGLFPHWTVERNIATVPRLLKWSKAKTHNRVIELLTLLDMDPKIFCKKYPNQLSGGQQQRVGVARALAGNPEVLLMDEPFGALDPITRDSLQMEMSRIHKNTGTTVVFVTHDMDEALKMATRIAVMDKGKILQYAAPIEILRNPAHDFVKEFVGRSDFGLKLLAVQKVRDRFHINQQTSGDPISPDMPLREALSLMILHGCDNLPVEGGDPLVKGVIRLQDILGI